MASNNLLPKTASKIPKFNDLRASLNYSDDRKPLGPSFWKHLQAFRELYITPYGTVGCDFIKWKDQEHIRGLSKMADNYLDINGNGVKFWPNDSNAPEHSSLQYSKHEAYIKATLIQILFRLNRQQHSNNKYKHRKKVAGVDSNRNDSSHKPPETSSSTNKSASARGFFHPLREGHISSSFRREELSPTPIDPSLTATGTGDSEADPYMVPESPKSNSQEDHVSTQFDPRKDGPSTQSHSATPPKESTNHKPQQTSSGKKRRRTSDAPIYRNPTRLRRQAPKPSFITSKEEIDQACLSPRSTSAQPESVKDSERSQEEGPSKRFEPVRTVGEEPIRNTNRRGGHGTMSVDDTVAEYLRQKQTETLAGFSRAIDEVSRGEVHRQDDSRSLASDTRRPPSSVYTAPESVIGGPLFDASNIYEDSISWKASEPSHSQSTGDSANPDPSAGPSQEQLFLEKNDETPASPSAQAPAHAPVVPPVPVYYAAPEAFMGPIAAETDENTAVVLYPAEPEGATGQDISPRPSSTPTVAVLDDRAHVKDSSSQEVSHFKHQPYPAIPEGAVDQDISPLPSKSQNVVMLDDQAPAKDSSLQEVSHLKRQSEDVEPLQEVSHFKRQSEDIESKKPSPSEEPSLKDPAKSTSIQVTFILILSRYPRWRGQEWVPKGKFLKKTLPELKEELPPGFADNAPGLMFTLVGPGVRAEEPILREDDDTFGLMTKGYGAQMRKAMRKHPDGGVLSFRIEIEALRDDYLAGEEDCMMESDDEDLC